MGERTNRDVKRGNGAREEQEDWRQQIIRVGHKRNVGFH